MSRKLIAVILLSVLGCSGGGQVGTGGNQNSQVELNGRVAAGDQPVGQAHVSVMVGDVEAETQTDNDGRYSVTLSVAEDQLDHVVRIEATSAGTVAAGVTSKQYKWASMPGSVAAMQAAAGGVNSVSETDVARLLLTSYSTGEYATLKAANNGDELVSQIQLNDLLSTIDDASVMRLAALFELAMSDADYALPEAIDDTLALLEASSVSNVELGRFTQADPTRVANSANVIARREFGESNCDLLVPNAVLRGCDLTGVAHDSADLSNADFSFSLLMDTQFTHANLRNSVFALANGDQAYFESVDISGANFTATALPNTKFMHLNSDNIIFDGGVVVSSEFYKTSFVGASFVGANLANALIHQSTFSNTDFRNANLSNVVFDHVYLDGSNFVGANLSGATFDNVSTDGVIWNGAICPDGSVSTGTCDISPAERPDCDNPGSGANLRGCIFNYQNLAGMDLSNADLQNASLRGAALQGANLTGANLTNAQLQTAALQQATLTNANLSQANLHYASLAQAVITGVVWTGATCPNGQTAGSQGCSTQN